MGRRIQHDPRPRRESPGQWRTVPRPVDWPARVEAVLKRDRVCQWPMSYLPGDVCGATEHLEVDHIGDPADHDLDNLRALCRRHHRYRTGQQGGQAAARRRPRRQRPPEQHPGVL